MGENDDFCSFVVVVVVVFVVFRLSDMQLLTLSLATTTPTTTVSLDLYAADVEGKISDGGQSAVAAEVAC